MEWFSEVGATGGGRGEGGEGHCVWGKVSVVAIIQKKVVSLLIILFPPWVERMMIFV